MVIKTTLRLLMAIFFIACQACTEKGDRNPNIEKPSQQIKLVRVHHVEAVPLRGDIEVVGALSSHLKVNVATEMGGIIERLFFERGDRVTGGQILAEVSTSSIQLEVQQAEAALAVAGSQLKKAEKGSRPEEIRIAMAALGQSEAALSEAENNFKRMKKLHVDHAVSNRDYDSAKKVVEAARASVESARQQLELVKQGPRIEDREVARASLKQAQAASAMAKDRLRKSRLHSPCDCIIAFRRVEEGEVVGPGTIITQVVDNRRMKIKVSLADRDLPLLEKDKLFPFTVDAMPGKRFTCRLTFLSPTADPMTRSFPLELSVDQPDAGMTDGMTARVKFPLKNSKKSIKVPSAWLSEENGHMGLFVVEDGKALFKRVKMGFYYEQKVEILSGLSDQDLVISNPAGLKSGDAVKY